LWIVERDLENFDTATWHKEWEIENGPKTLRGEEAYNECGTVHCIAGFAQVMTQAKGFSYNPDVVGYHLLGSEANSHFWDNNEEGLAFLKEVIARNS
jgi:hypothetical protein